MEYPMYNHFVKIKSELVLQKLNIFDLLNNNTISSTSESTKKLIYR